MAKINDPKTLCEKLLRCETEEEVTQVLESAGYWDKRDAWKAYGDISNNRGVVSNQQSSPVAALVEKIVNSVDAVLTSECWLAGIDPTSDAAPKSMAAAVDTLLGVRNGKIESLDSSGRTELASRIRLVATGTKEQPCYMIIDDGEGQTPEQFPSTFLSLLRENKARVPFVQGKYNMGGTGVLQFAGRNSFQLIISRRQEELMPPGTRSRWGFTLIRRLDPLPGQPFTAYVYLAPNNQILSFDSDGMDLLPGKYPNAYADTLLAGSCIKLWNYKIPGRLKSIATIDLRYALERYLQDPALPIRIQERRVGYRANYYDTTMSGLFSVLADNKERIEPGFDTGSALAVPGVGNITLRMVVLKEEVEDDKRYPAGVFFNVNGQLHGELGADFIERRAKLDYIANSLIVTVDCTGLPERVREDLFLASRDRMRQIGERYALEDAIIDYLQDHPGLKGLNAKRREERISKSTEKDAVDIIQDLVRSDPTLASLFGRGKLIKVPTGPLPEPEPYSGKQFPTVFKLLKEPSTGLVKKCPQNRACKVVFETDAVNDYFSRTADPGRLSAKGVPQLSGAHLWNGRATVRFTIPDTTNVGDRLVVTTETADISRPEPFRASFVIEVEPAVLPSEHGEPPPPHHSGTVSLPKPIEVRQDEWSKHGFDEYSAVKLKHGDEEQLDLYINMDNIYVRNEIARRRKMDPDLIRYWFKYGLMLSVVGLLYDQRKQGEKRSGDGAAGSGDDFVKIADACRGLAVTLIPIMVQLSKGPARARV